MVFANPSYFVKCPSTTTFPFKQPPTPSLAVAGDTGVLLGSAASPCHKIGLQHKWPNQQIAMLLEISSLRLRSLLNKKNMISPHPETKNTSCFAQSFRIQPLKKQVHDRPSALIEIKISVGYLIKDDKVWRICWRICWLLISWNQIRWL